MTEETIPEQFDLDNVGNGQANTEITYLYRDGANYKNATRVVLAGALTLGDIRTIAAKLEEDEMFIPSGVGLPDIQQSWDDELDHPFHQITGVGPTDHAPTEKITVTELVALFAVADWDKEQVRVNAEHA